MQGIGENQSFAVSGGCAGLQPYPQDYCLYSRKAAFISSEVQIVPWCGILALPGAAISSLSAPKSKQLFVSEPVLEVPSSSGRTRSASLGKGTWKLPESKWMLPWKIPAAPVLRAAGKASPYFSFIELLQKPLNQSVCCPVVRTLISQ